MSNSTNSMTRVLRRKMAGMLTIAFAGAMAVGVTGALAATAPATPSLSETSAVAQSAPKKLDRKWVWKKKAVSFDDMYRSKR